MSELHILSVTKQFGTVPVLHGIDLVIRQGEFFTLLGPSGCGKTTLLRVLAGFLMPDSGSVMLGRQRLDLLPAHQRDIGMVFQDYAVFPHLTVAENIGFGLKARSVSSAQMRERVQEAMQMVQLDGLADRLPSALSGGQQQRVGLARAIAIRPQLLLMDEPLSNLDAKLRTELRDEIRDLQKRLGITTIYVTHDQEEALAVSDRICVMNRGRAEQTDDPFTIYSAPATRFAASFVGTMNFIPCDNHGASLRIGQDGLAQTHALQGMCPRGAFELAIRPEHIEIVSGTDSRPDGYVLQGRVEKTVYLGREVQIKLALNGYSLLVQTPVPSRRNLAREGDRISVWLPFAHLVMCHPDGRAGALQPS